jgi:hypothetical protein
MSTSTIDLNKTLGDRFAHILQPGATLTEDDAAAMADELLAALHIPRTIWSRGDLDDAAEDNAAEGKAQAVGDHLWANRGGYLKNLGDATDRDWQLIADAARDAANDLGHSN